MLRGTVAIAVALFIGCFVALKCAIATGALAPTGAFFDVRTGVVQTVTPGSPAAAAGISAGDRMDFARSSWMDHSALNRIYVYGARPLTYHLLHQGTPYTATVRLTRRTASPDATTNYIDALAVTIYGGLGLLLFLLRRNSASFIFLLFSCAQAIAYSDNLVYLRIATPQTMPLAFAFGTLTPLFAQFGFLYFALLFANTTPRRESMLRFVVLPLAGLGALLYYLHFYSATIWPEPVSVYLLSTILNWITFATGAVMITIRLTQDRAALPRLRWVAAGIWLQSLLQGAFYIDQNIAPLTSGGTALITDLNAWFQPATLCVAYVLLQTRVVDVRVVGTRTIVYAMLTAIPIALFSVADWFFAKRLEDARLATFVEFGVAVGFGIWLNTLHKRIDRFVERIVFAARQRGFLHLRNAIHALPAVQYSQTVYEMLTAKCADALRLASAAVFVEQNGTFERVADFGWDGCARTIANDDPLALHVRSRGHAVHVTEFASSTSAVPAGDGSPEFVVPLSTHREVTGFTVYGRHHSGEHLDNGEEELLTELAHAAAAALARLQSADRIHELEMRVELLAHAQALR